MRTYPKEKIASIIALPALYSQPLTSMALIFMEEIWKGPNEMRQN